MFNLNTNKMTYFYYKTNQTWNGQPQYVQKTHTTDETIDLWNISPYIFPIYFVAKKPPENSENYIRVELFWCNFPSFSKPHRTEGLF